MTETVIYFLVGFVACFILDWIMLRRLKKEYRIASDVIRIMSNNFADHRYELGGLRDDIHKLRNFLTAQASEASKKVDWEPDDYKDLSDGMVDKIEKVFEENNFKEQSGTNYERFGDDELDKVSQMIPEGKLRKFGG